MTHSRDVKFIVKEYLGTEVYKGLDPETKHYPKEPLRGFDDVKEGDEVIVPWVTGGFFKATVKKDEGGGLYAEAGQLIAPLVFDGRWAVGGFLNLKAVTKLTVTPPVRPAPPDHSPTAASSPLPAPPATPAEPPTTGSGPTGQPPP